MAFVSVLSSRDRSRKCGRPSVKFRFSKSSSCGGHISSAIPLHGKRIEIQIDDDVKKIRLRESEQGFSVSKQGTFSCSKGVYEKIGGNTVYLELREDGWWYGSYADTDGQ